jgi:hypothetical protein
MHYGALSGRLAALSGRLAALFGRLTALFGRLRWCSLHLLSEDLQLVLTSLPAFVNIPTADSCVTLLGCSSPTNRNPLVPLCFRIADCYQVQVLTVARIREIYNQNLLSRLYFLQQFIQKL